MVLPGQPVTLSAEQIGELNQQLANMRHDINNHLSLMLAAIELIRHKPQMTDRMMTTFLEQPPKITSTIARFTAAFEARLGVEPR